MVSSLSNLVNNLSEGIHRIKRKCEHDDKKFQSCWIKYKYCDCFLEYTNFRADFIEYKCSCCRKNYQRKFDEKLKERLFNPYKLSNDDNNKFILLFRNGVYRHEYIDDWEKFNETSLFKKEDFYSHLNMEDITDVDYTLVKGVCKDLERWFEKKMRKIT